MRNVWERWQSSDHPRVKVFNRSNADVAERGYTQAQAGRVNYHLDICHGTQSLPDGEEPALFHLAIRNKSWRSLALLLNTVHCVTTSPIWIQSETLEKHEIPQVWDW